MTARQAVGGLPAATTPAQRWVLALASLASFMVILDMLVVATALTAIRRHPAPRSATWSGRSTPTR